MYNILICDDEPDIVAALKIYLTGDDYCLFEANNGRQALEVVEEHDIHLVLLDIMMPEMDGIQTLSRIRENHNMPVIFLTAKGEDTDKILGLNIGADDYVTKPFNPVELLARVKSQLRRYLELPGTGKNPSSRWEISNWMIPLRKCALWEKRQSDAEANTDSSSFWKIRVRCFHRQRSTMQYGTRQLTALRESAAHIRHLREKLRSIRTASSFKSCLGTRI